MQSDALLQDVTNGQYRSNIPPGLIDDVTLAIGFNTEIRNRVYSTGARQTKNELLVGIKMRQTGWEIMTSVLKRRPIPYQTSNLKSPIGGEFWEVEVCIQIKWDKQR